MIEIRKSQDVVTSLHIAELKLRLPADDSWTSIPDSAWIDDHEHRIRNLFESGFIDVRACNVGPYPAWYLTKIASNIRIPMELLNLSFDEFESEVTQMKAFSHNAIWTIIRGGLICKELTDLERPQYISLLEAR